MKFFVESSNFGQLLAAEFTQLGLKVTQNQLTLSKPTIVSTNAVATPTTPKAVSRKKEDNEEEKETNFSSHPFTFIQA